MSIGKRTAALALLISTALSQGFAQDLIQPGPDGLFPTLPAPLVLAVEEVAGPDGKAIPAAVITFPEAKDRLDVSSVTLATFPAQAIAEVSFWLSDNDAAQLTFAVKDLDDPDWRRDWRNPISVPQQTKGSWKHLRTWLRNGTDEPHSLCLMFVGQGEPGARVEITDIQIRLRPLNKTTEEDRQRIQAILSKGAGE